MPICEGNYKNCPKVPDIFNAKHSEVFKAFLEFKHNLSQTVNCSYFVHCVRNFENFLAVT